MSTMWDRLRTSHKDGATPLNRKTQEDWQNSRPGQIAGGYSYSIKGGPAPLRPPRDFEYPTENHKQSSAAPAVQAPYPPQAGRDSYRSSQYGRPASSIYSQPSPAAATFAARQLRNDYNQADISPPSSPDVSAPRNAHHSYHDGDVSPIEEVSENSHFSMDRPQPSEQQQSRSNIPMMRRERRKNSDAAISALRESKSRERLRQPRPHGNDVRWDRHTGEPTTSDKGRPSQVNPHQLVEVLSKGQPPTGAAQRASPNNSPFGERIRLKQTPRQASGGSQVEPAPKPEWRGASGRTTLVAPVSDTRNVTPLVIPRKSSKRATRGPGVLSPVDSLSYETASSPPARSALTRTALPSQINSPVSPAQVVPAQTDPNAYAQSSYPSPPLRHDNLASAKAAQPPPRPPPHSESPQTLFPPVDKALRRKPAAGGHIPHVSTSSSVYSQHDTHPAQAPASAQPEDWTQPPSRFSVTTYATSHSDSPRPSGDHDAPPMPTPPRQFTESPKSGTGSSILDRKRPIVSGYEHIPKRESPEPIRLNMNSPYYISSADANRPLGPRPVPHGNHSTLSVVSVTSRDKNLPPAPPEETARDRDRVTQLNAKLQSLGNRRININQAIKQMTELMPTDNVLASDAVILKREAEKRKVEVLKEELADVQREEYELGLKLHRAYKRMDRDAVFEPTTLWVRRVTG